MSTLRDNLLREHGYEIGRDILLGVLDLAKSVPFVGVFAEVLKKAVEICDNFKANHAVANRLKDRLLDAGCFVDIACRKYPTKSNILQTFTNKLVTALRDANQYLEKFANQGFLGALLVGTKPVKKINEIDEKITAILNDMSIAVNLTQLEVAKSTYDVVCDVEAWLHENGGYAGIANDNGKLQEFAKLLGRFYLCCNLIIRSLTSGHIVISIDCSAEELRGEISQYLNRLEQGVMGQFEAMQAQFDEIKNQLQAMRDQDKQQRQHPGRVGAHIQDSSELPKLDMSRLSVRKDNVLGEGGFGTVYGGFYNGEPVAIKTMKRNNMHLTEKQLEELRKEVIMLQIVGKFPGIVRMYGANLDYSQGELCIVLEKAEGSLDDCIYSDKLPVALTLFTKVGFALDIARAMEAIAKLGMFFRDAKPLNVLIFFVGTSRRVVAKLTDFGLAKMSTDCTTGGIKGTIPYMAPELFSAAPNGAVPFSFESDVYAFGILLNELLTEARPYHEFVGGIDRLALDVCRGVRPKLYSAERRHFAAGKALELIVKACLHGNPTNRAKFSKVVEDLQRISSIVLDTAKVGKTSVYVAAPIPLASVLNIPLNPSPSPSAKASSENSSSKSASSSSQVCDKKLEDLSVEEVVAMLGKLDMSEACCALAKENKVSGYILDMVETVDDLPECGLDSKVMTALHARGLVKKLKSFKEKGVPSHLISSVSSLSPPSSASNSAPNSAPGSAANSVNNPVPMTAWMPSTDSLLSNIVQIAPFARDHGELYQNGHGGMTSDMLDMGGGKGKLISFDADGDCRVEINGVTKCWSPELVLVLQQNGTKPLMSVAALQTIEGKRPLLPVESVVTVMQLNNQTAHDLQGNVDGGYSSQMERFTGSEGVIQYVYPNGDVRLKMLSDPTVILTWCRSLVTKNRKTNPTASSSSCTPYCINHHTMKRLTGVQTAFPGARCALCKRSQLSRSADYYYGCTMCCTPSGDSLCVCDNCTTAKVGSSVIIRSEATESEMKEKQRGHGGFRDNMLESRGKRGLIAKIDDDGDIAVIFDKSQGLSSVGFFYHPWLVMIDTSVNSITVGSPVRLSNNRSTASAAHSKLKLAFGDANVAQLGSVGRVVDAKPSDENDLVFKVKLDKGGTEFWWPRSLLSHPDEPTTHPLQDNVKLPNPPVVAPPVTKPTPPPSPVVAEPIITPDRPSRGKGVRIKTMTISQAQSAQARSGGLHPWMIRLMSRLGRVVQVDDNGNVHVLIDGQIWCWNPSLVEVLPPFTSPQDEVHSGEWRDHSIVKYRCAKTMESCVDCQFLCEHSGGVKNESHWSCCGKTTKSASGCQQLHPLPPCSVNSLVRIRSVSWSEVETHQRGHGRTVDEMREHIGKVGRIVSIDKDGDVHVAINGRSLCWNPVLVEDVTNHCIVPICQRGHVMTHYSTTPISYNGTVLCDCCRRPSLEDDRFMYNCSDCQYDLCIRCSQCVDGSPIKLRANISDTELTKAQQQILGGSKRGTTVQSLKQVIGKIGYVIRIEDGWIHCIIADTSTGSLIKNPDVNSRLGNNGGEEHVFLINPNLLHLDSTRLHPYKIGCFVRIRYDMNKNDFKQLQSKVPDGFKDDMYNCMGRLGIVKELNIIGLPRIICGDYDFTWNPKVLTYTATGTSDLTSNMRVKVIQAEESVIRQYQQHMNITITSDMLNCVNKEGSIVEIDGNRCNTKLVKVNINNKIFLWNPLLLQVLPPQATVATPLNNNNNSTDVTVRIKQVSIATANTLQGPLGGLLDEMRSMIGKVRTVDLYS